MDSLLAQNDSNQEQNDLRSSLCYYLSIILVLSAFIMSCFSLGLCNSSTIQAKMYKYAFPYFSQFVSIPAGTPVSIDGDGNAWPGAGTTIYRNVTSESIDYPMINVKLRELGHHMTLAVYDGGVTALSGSFDGTTLVVSRQSIKLDTIDDVIPLNNERFVILGDHKLLCLTAKTELVDRTVKVTFYQGEVVEIGDDDDIWPHIDNLSNTTIAMIYERGDNVYTRVGTWNGEGVGAKIVLGKESTVSQRYEYHGIAGMDSSHFIISVTGMRYGQNFSTPVVSSTLCEVDNSQAITCIAPWIELPWTASHNFFDMDNMGPEDVIMVYTDADDNGINAVMIHYDKDSNSIYYGSQVEVQNGGSESIESTIDIRVLSPDTFAVFYEDYAIRGLVVVMGAITESNDIVITSPRYIISRSYTSPNDLGASYADPTSEPTPGPHPEPHEDDYSFDICGIDEGDFMMVEYRNTGRERKAMIHRGDVLARPFGISMGSKKNQLYVQFAGMVKIPGKTTFTPGRAVYTNSNGELLEGRPYGYANRDFGQFYEFSRDGNQILSLNNLVGLAVTKHKIYLKFY